MTTTRCVRPERKLRIPLPRNEKCKITVYAAHQNTIKCKLTCHRGTHCSHSASQRAPPRVHLEKSSKRSTKHRPFSGCTLDQFKILIVLPENVRELFVGADEFFYLRTNFLFGFLKKRVFGVSSAAMPPLMPVWHVDHAHGIHFTIAFGTRACCMSLG